MQGKKEKKEGKSTGSSDTSSKNKDRKDAMLRISHQGNHHCMGFINGVSALCKT